MISTTGKTRKGVPGVAKTDWTTIPAVIECAPNTGMREDNGDDLGLEHLELQ